MVKETLKQLLKRLNVFYMASDLYLNIWNGWNTDRATTSTGKPVSILRCIAKKCRPFWHWICSMLVVQPAAWFLYWFAINIFIKCLSPVLLCFILSCLDISESKPTVCEMLRTSDWLDDGRNCKHSLNFNFYSFFSTLKQHRFVSQCQ